MIHLLPENRNFYKACLHTHSTVSDGKIDPEEVKKMYKARGYSILALTDHEICLPHPELNDEDFLTLTSYELLVEDGAPKINAKVYHLNFISKTPDNRWQFHHPDLRPYIANYLDQLVYDKPEIRTYGVEETNALIAKAKEKGFIATYNHPVWSMQGTEDYVGLKGLWGVEVYNNASYLLGYEEDMSQCYQEMLRAGHRVLPVAADDTHKPEHVGGGWVMICAEELSYSAVIDAMERGDLYASCGPEIHSLTVDGTKVKITCSDAVTVNLVTHGRHAMRILAEPGKLLKEAEFDLSAWLKKTTEDTYDRAFFRLCVTDATGKKAFTRAYYRNEIESEL